MTPQTSEQVRQLLVSIFSYAFIGLGGFVAFFNWVYFYLDQQYQRRGENRHVSMVVFLGLLLPIGCLINPSLRIHALWVWALDPLTLFLLLWAIQILVEKRAR